MLSYRRKIIFPNLSQRDRQRFEASHQRTPYLSQQDSDTNDPEMAGGTWHDSHTGEFEREDDVFSVAIPPYLRSAPILKDDLETKTSIAQDRTVLKCLPYLKGASNPTRNPFDFNEHGVASLDRQSHIRFLEHSLGENPEGYVSLDASRTWLVYWALMSLYLLGEDLTPFRSSVVKTFTSMQNPDGGIGGGQGQYSHLAGSYAAILSLALVGGVEAYSLFDRQTAWQWIGRLKQVDGGFRVCEGGEEDVRGAYCALVLISLLNLPFELPPSAPARRSGLSTFGDGLGEYLSKCQTYEGGISSCPGGEAHGAYAFCALACLCLLDQPHIALPKYLDVDALLPWLSSRQYAPEGGLSGRTNKLVDGCYSHWLGGCWPLVQAALDGPRSTTEVTTSATVGSLFSRQGLTRYILGCCQAEMGGMRDKPSMNPDTYHSCYCLAGLSMVQHVHYFEEPENNDLFASVVTWKALDSSQVRDPRAEPEVFDESDMVCAMHPVYVISHQAVTSMRKWAEGFDNTAWTQQL